jgi:hypothetical protein
MTERSHLVQSPYSPRMAAVIPSRERLTLSDSLSVSGLRTKGIELDQKLLAAFRLGADCRTYDSQIFHALNRLNVVSTRILEIDRNIHRLQDFDTRNYLVDPVYIDRYSDDFPIAIGLQQILEDAIQFRRHEHTLGTGDFLNALLSHCTSDEPLIRTQQLLAVMYEGNEGVPLEKIPEVGKLLDRLRSGVSGDEDVQYLLGLENNRLVFRPWSVLGDYVQQTGTGLLLPQRGLLTHLEGTFGIITSDQIEELEGLLNSRAAKELDFQAFFERNPHFFRQWDYREVHPHVYLTGPDQDAMVPDFILTDRELQKSLILDLKLPSPRLVRRQKNRDRFAASVLEARAQLLTYRDWFRVPENRLRLKDRLGLEIYEPRLAVIIGRASEFQDELDRQRLQSRNPEIEIVTYDDLLVSARRRQLFIKEG